MQSPFLHVLFVLATLLAAVLAVPNLHSGSFGLQFRNSDRTSFRRPQKFIKGLWLMETTQYSAGTNPLFADMGRLSSK